MRVARFIHFTGDFAILKGLPFARFSATFRNLYCVCVCFQDVTWFRVWAKELWFFRRSSTSRVRHKRAESNFSANSKPNFIHVLVYVWNEILKDLVVQNLKSRDFYGCFIKYFISRRYSIMEIGKYAHLEHNTED